jgi:L-alanine-DL-glutamate epimerase-like enolase superfamily enzyme
MNIHWKPLDLHLRTTFRIAHGADDVRHNVLLYIDEGLGEAAAVRYHGESQDGIMAYLKNAASQIGDDPFLIEDIIYKLPLGSAAARASIDIALYDLIGKRLGVPLFKLLGLNHQRVPPTCFTLSIDEPEALAERARTSNYPILKIKLGGPNDLKSLAAIRGATNARLRVDANAGWTLPQALDIIPRLVEYDLEFIEQPLPAGDIDGLRVLKQRIKKQGISINFFADEPIKTPADVIAHAGVADGVVIKLMKSGGIRQALKMIHIARALDMQVMMGCMVESSLGVTAAAHLAPLCDYVDLDGPLLIKDDPFTGLTYRNAEITLPDLPGIGVTRK